MAGIEALIVTVVLLAFGYLLAEAILDRFRLPAVMYWGLALPALAAYTVALMLLHMATGGRIVSEPWLIRGLTLAVAAALVVLRGRRRRGRGEAAEGSLRRDLLVAGGLALVAIVVWGTPVFRLLPIDAAGDTPWHMGLSTQMLNGETTPSSTVTGAVPNYYPWLFHALIAFLTHFTPGGRAYHGLSTLQLLLAGGTALTFYALGRELIGTWIGGAAAAVLGAMSGGFGFIRLDKLDVVMDPRAPNALRYVGDLVYKRSYNVSFANFAPPFPRDLALALLVGFLLLLIAGLRRRNEALLVASGATLGMAGLVGNESFSVGLGVAVLVCLAPLSLPRRRVAAAVLVPALAVFAIWLVPIAVSYVRLGGFVNITKVGAVDLTPVAIIGAWGVSTPLAAYGFFRLVRRTREDPGPRVLLALLVVTGGALLGSVIIEGLFGEAFRSISRRHRFWPLLHLAIVLYGAWGAALLIEWVGQWRWMGRWHRAAAATVAFGILAISLASPTLASVALPGEHGPPGVVQASLTGDRSTVLSLLASRGRCHAAVPSKMAHRAFAYTGYRFVFYRWSAYDTNYARIRWRNIYEHIPGDEERRSENVILVNGTTDQETWAALARKYSLDLVVVPEEKASSPAFAGYPRLRSRPGWEQPYVVIVLGPCPS